MRTHLLTITCMLLAATAVTTTGCETVAPEGNEGTVTLQLALNGGYFSGKDVKSFEVKLYNSPPSSPVDAAAWSSGCKAYSGDAVVLDTLEEGSGRVVVFDAYTDDSCTDLAFRGVRGDITVTKFDGTGERDLYYIHLIEVGEITALPLKKNAKLGQLNRSPCDPAGGSEKSCSDLISGIDAECNADTSLCYVPCESDGDCTDIHPRAVCIEGGCEMGSLFPLSTTSSRAFHQAFSLPDGRVVLAGGFTAEGTAAPMSGVQGTYFDAVVPEYAVEVFNGKTGLFELPEVGDLSLPGMAGVAHLSGEKFAVFGGATSANLFYDLGQYTFGMELDGLVDEVTVIDGKGFDTKTSSLANAVAGAVGSWVDLSSGPALHVVGGLASSGSVSGIQTCDLDETLSLSCEATGTISAPRFGHSSVCLQSSSEVCKDFLVYGGKASGNDNLGDLLRVSEGDEYGPVDDPSNLGPLASIYGAKVIVSGTTVYSFGGTTYPTDDTRVARPNVPAYFYQINPGKEIMYPTPLSIEGLPEDVTLQRVFHTVTDLGDGKVLIVGGLDEDGKASSYAVIIEVGVDADDDSKAQYVTHFSLSQPRFGHTTSVIEDGVLEGAYLISGGMNILGDGTLQFADGAEIYFP